MKKVAWIPAAFATVAVIMWASPILAAPSIAVTAPGGGLNGTNHSLEVTFDGTAGEAVVVSSHPANERTFNVDFWVNANNVSLCAGVNCRLFILRAWGNREGPIRDAFRVGLKQNAFGYRVLLWYKDRSSVNPGDWEQINGPFLANGTTDAKVTVEWTGADDGMNNGTTRLLLNDVLANPGHAVTGINSPLEVDLVRMGHTNGAVRAGALGSIFLDEYVSTR